ncbi:uncharacterized protein LOC108934167 [Scleropages formosus]|uniref:uncharacterized protein LOC108934167 n=1 Tax=Scleropages formosus TaxID=113540 RepID=UPI0010FA7CDD|nr:uncharacterized protein LOC108934167 [Scleropages formosus]
MLYNLPAGTSRKPVEKDPEKIMGNVSNSFTVCKTPKSEKTTLRSFSERKCQTGKDFIPLSQLPKKFRPVKCQKKLLQPVVTAAQGEGVKASCETELTTQPVCEPLSTLEELNSEVQSKEDLKNKLCKVQLEKNESENIPAGDPKSLKRHEPQNKARLFIFADEVEKKSVLQRKEGKHPSLFPSQPLSLKNMPSEEITPVFLKFKGSEMHDPEKLYEVCWMQLLHVGKAFFSSSRFKRIVTDEGETNVTCYNSE